MESQEASAPVGRETAPGIDVLGLGAVAVDDLVFVNSRWAPDTKVAIDRRERRCGGLSAVALIAAQRLGSRCAYAGLLGFDESSEYVIGCLKEEGIDLRYAVRRPDARPAQSIVVVDGSGRRTIFCDRSGRFGADDLLPEQHVIQSARVLLVDHCGVQGMLRAGRLARAAGRPVVADFEDDRSPGFSQLLDLTTHLILPAAFACRITGTADPARAAAGLRTGECAVSAVTCGAEGCWYVTPESPSPQFLPAFKIDAHDTTGCGDVFHGAFASALARQLPPAECLRLASAAAALKACRRRGRCEPPTRDELECFLAGCGG